MHPVSVPDTMNYTAVWKDGLSGMRHLFGTESPEYQMFLRLTIQELEKFYDHYKLGYDHTDTKKMQRLRHRLRPTLRIFGGEYWCDRLKMSDFQKQAQDLQEMKDWLLGLIAYLRSEQTQRFT